MADSDTETKKPTLLIVDDEEGPRQSLNMDLESTRGAADPAMVRGQLKKVDKQVGRCIALSRRYLDYAYQRASGKSEVRVNQCMKDVHDLVAPNPAPGTTPLSSSH